MAGADRSINMALRVLGIGEVERDFKRVGDAGAKSFAEVKKSANGAAQEVSEYTARLRRAVTEANRLANQIPQLSKGTPESRTNRAGFIKGAVEAEQERILKGAPEVTAALNDQAEAAGGLGEALGGLSSPAALATAAFTALAVFVVSSLKAFAAHEAALGAFHAELQLTGIESKATANEIVAMAGRIVASSGQTEEATLKGALALSKVAGLTKEAFETALAASAAYADAVGRDLPDVIEGTTAPVLQALADRDMKALFEAVEGLNKPLRTLILNLAEAGRTADAQRVLIAALAEAAGDGPGGLTDAANTATGAWERFKVSVGETFGGAAISTLNVLSSGLDMLTLKSDRAKDAWKGLAATIAMFALNPSQVIGDVTGLGRMEGRRPPKGGRGGGRAPAGDMVRLITDDYDRSLASPAGNKSLDYFEKKYGGGGGGRKRKGGGGRKGGGTKDNTAARMKREAEQAEEAAQRIEDANIAVIDSWSDRADAVEAKVGLEGEALKAVERSQAIEAAVRQVNLDLIEKEVEAQRKRAALTKTQFDEAKATEEAAAMVERQQEAVRGLAERYVDANEQIAEFNKRQAQAKSVLDDLKTPLDRVNDDIEQAIELLRNHNITVDQFNERMKQLSYRVADAQLELDKGRQAWVGFGRDVAGSLADIALNGGSAMDVLKELIRLPLERLMEQNFVNPLANWIDGLTGVNRDKNAAGVLGGLPSAGQVLGATTGIDNPLAPASELAAGSIGQMTFQVELATQALGQFMAGLQASSLGGATGGGGGFGGLLGQITSALGAGGGGLGGAGSSAGFSTAVSNISAAMGFASGTPGVPVGQPFWVGENGKELMQMHAGGRLEVINGPRTHRAMQGGGGVTIVQNNYIPARVDPRRTASGMARSTQGALARANRKGLAVVGGRND